VHPPTATTTSVAGVGCDAAEVNRFMPAVDDVDNLSSGVCESSAENLDCKPVVDSLPFSMTPPLGGVTINHVCNGSSPSRDKTSQKDSPDNV
jgi:hypothetical protein